MINQNEIAAANIGNLSQAKPLLNDILTNDEKHADIHEINKKSIAKIIQFILIQPHEDFKKE